MVERKVIIMKCSKFFHANLNTDKKKFVICLPPPNVTGNLHIGHALTTAIQDSIVRRKRMQNYETLYIPGTDHAGIATQTVVEKQLFKETGKTRYDLGREEFVKKVWEWKEKSGSFILNQLRRVGASLDWEREFFTMDSQLSESVAEAFTQLFDKKLIYRANRLVNWSCSLKTAISDIEVEFQDIEKATMIEVPGYDKRVEFGVLIYFAYKLKEDPSKEIVVATTRIETMLGDVAVAVHPNDARYKDFVGKELVHPFIPGRTLKVITDDYVEADFGTGAVKITPAHDPNDYAIGQRHNLEFINVFTEEGLINENGGQFAGQKRFHCRKAIEEELKKIGLWRDKKDNKMRLGTCQRSGDVIEPLIKPQWYVNCS